MSRRENCWDNAPQESFFGHMKDELHLKECDSYENVCKELDDYFDYYNNDRCQWGLNKILFNIVIIYLINLEQV